jgi:GAF domain-containing protein
MLAPTDYALSIAEAARTLNKPRSVHDTLQTIVEVACNSVPGFDNAGIATLAIDGGIVTRASVGDVVLPLDRMQYDLREGPCSEVLLLGQEVCASSLEREQRWPEYVPQAREMGVRSQLAVQLLLDGDTLGGINFYSTTSDHVSVDAQALAALFATHAAIALGHAHEREQWREALQGSRVIGPAIGLLMQRYDMDQDRAFGFLVRASSFRNIKLRAIARELIDEANAAAGAHAKPGPGNAAAVVDKPN